MTWFAVLPAVRGLFAAALDGDGDLPTALRLASWLHRFWAARGLDEGRRWLQRLLEAEHGDGPERARPSSRSAISWLGPYRTPGPSASPRPPACSTVRTRSSSGRTTSLRQPPRTVAPATPERHYAAAIAAAHSAGLPDLVPWAARSAWRSSSSRVVTAARVSLATRRRWPPIERHANEEEVVVLLPQYALMLMSLGRFEDAHRALLRVERVLGDDVRITTMVAAAARRGWSDIVAASRRRPPARPPRRCDDRQRRGRSSRRSHRTHAGAGRARRR